MDMKKILLLLLMWSVLIISAMADEEDQAPEEPGIVLPSTLLEIQDISVEDISAALPADSELPAPVIKIPLPEEEALSIPEAAFSLEVPADVEIQVERGNENSFYSEGILGGGNMNHILGSITLYKMGTNPRFSIHFSHESLDGYLLGTTFKDAGGGFFHRNDTLEGTFSVQADKLTIDSSAFFRENEEGLQNLSTLYSSVTTSSLGTDGNLKLELSDSIDLTGSLKADYASMLLSGSTPKPTSELFLKPAVGGTLSMTDLDLTLEGWYNLRYRNMFETGTENTLLQYTGAVLSAEATLPYSIFLEGDVGVAWDFNSTLHVPFTVNVSGSYETIFSYEVTGGYKHEESTFLALWEETSFIQPKQDLNDTAGWFFSGGIDWIMIKGLTLEADFGFSLLSGVVSKTTDTNSTSGLLTYEEKNNFTTIKPALGINWNYQNMLKINAGWMWNALDRKTYSPEHTFSLAVDFTETQNTWGVGFSSKAKYWNAAFQMPELDLKGFWQITEGVTFLLETKDLLSPLITGGRLDWGRYLTPGFHGTFITQISL